MKHWEERLNADQHKKVSAAISGFRNSKKNRKAQADLYDALEMAGITSEEAEEMIRLETADNS